MYVYRCGTGHLNDIGRERDADKNKDNEKEVGGRGGAWEQGRMIAETVTHRGWPHRGPGVCAICVHDRCEAVKGKAGFRGVGAGGGKLGAELDLFAEDDLLVRNGAMSVLLLLILATLYVVFG